MPAKNSTKVKHAASITRANIRVTKRSNEKKYLIDSYLNVFSTKHQQLILRVIIKSGVSLFTFNRIRRTLVTESYSALHDDLKIIYNVLKESNHIFLERLGFELKSVDDLIQKTSAHAGINK